MVKDKDVQSVLKLLPKNALYYFTQSHIPRALPVEELAAQANEIGLNGTNFEDVNILLIHILKLCINDTNPNTPNIIDNKISQVSHILKGLNGENKIEIILNKLNPSSNVIRNPTSNTYNDFNVIREGKNNILVNSKETNINVKTEEVDEFIKKCQEFKSHGIFMSQNGGIINKYNYQIDILNNTSIIVYVHFAEYNEEKIKIAFDIIDSIYDKVKNIDNSCELEISKETLIEINKEYQFFIKQKEELKTYIKENQFKLLNQLEDVKLNNLSKYLSTNFLSSEKVGMYKCELCNFYTSNTLKGIAAHKRGCKKKYDQNTNLNSTSIICSI
jgi:hypothetical protein